MYELIDRQIKCQFNQGLDIRLLDDENSLLLSELNYWGEYVFAFDDIRYLSVLEEKVKLLAWARDWKLKFFTYVHPDMETSNIVQRIEWLRKHRYMPYVMRDISCWGSDLQDFYTDIAAWCNQVHIFKRLDFDDFLVRRHKKLSRVRCSKALYDGGRKV